MWKDYPELVAKNDKGQFEYKVSFLKRSKRIEYFLNIKEDGADTLNNIMEFYRDKGNPKYPKYMREFKELSKRAPTNAVILLFDNELSEKESPVSKFLRKCSLSGQNEKLKENRILHIQDNAYIMVTPLVNELEYTDIEMLFDNEVQDVEINGRKLDKTGKKDKEKFFNKDIFSHYIMRNYEKINFDNFRLMLDDIRSVVELYQKRIKTETK